ncbi:hypothetical protein M407DRAFT_77131 [Tulasnella calospora MUT 4182]|uniref:AB hydrolase-1 domain-containing protein n=1 Tax=Tulasnella calospora MUT 4182 TaxID=1051891 RepID=A0A0C3QEI3_9AGAM|nr:hypothetical protein M407DRAFT_77131 [Tulasnella calospora MUT 4182]
MSQTKPSIIFVPGGWHEPHVFDPVISILQSKGYKTLAVSLPSIGTSPPVDDLQPDVSAIREAIVSCTDAGSEVVVFAHSYGGFPSSEAIKGLTKSDLQSQGKSGGVLLDDATVIMAIDPVETFYGDLPRETAERYAAGLKRQSYKVFASKLTYAAWRHVPTTYLYTENDSALPLLYQKMMVEGSGAEVKTETFNAGHSVFLALPEKVAESVRRAAGESV